MICKFPVCQRLATEHGLCIPHRIYKDSGIPDRNPGKPEIPEIPVKKKKAFAKKTPQQRKLEAELRKMAIQERQQYDNLCGCEINSRDCIGSFDGWHHKQKKSPSNYTKRSNLLRSCNPCNTFLESHTSWGEERGFIISKHKK